MILPVYRAAGRLAREVRSPDGLSGIEPVCGWEEFSFRPTPAAWRPGVAAHAVVAASKPAGHVASPPGWRLALVPRPERAPGLAEKGVDRRIAADREPQWELLPPAGHCGLSAAGALRLARKGDKGLQLTDAPAELPPDLAAELAAAEEYDPAEIVPLPAVCTGPKCRAEWVDGNGNGAVRAPSLDHCRCFYCGSRLVPHPKFPGVVSAKRRRELARAAALAANPAVAAILEEPDHDDDGPAGEPGGVAPPPLPAAAPPAVGCPAGIDGGRPRPPASRAEGRAPGAGAGPPPLSDDVGPCSPVGPVEVRWAKAPPPEPPRPARGDHYAVGPAFWRHGQGPYPSYRGTDEDGCHRGVPYDARVEPCMLTAGSGPLTEAKPEPMGPKPEPMGPKPAGPGGQLSLF